MVNHLMITNTEKCEDVYQTHQIGENVSITISFASFQDVD
jgi:hypothetical protein